MAGETHKAFNVIHPPQLFWHFLRPNRGQAPELLVTDNAYDADRR
jgi:hypothetical protein